MTRRNKGKQIFVRGLKLKYNQYNPPTEDMPVNYFELIKNNVVKLEIVKKEMILKLAEIKKVCFKIENILLWAVV